MRGTAFSARVYLTSILNSKYLHGECLPCTSLTVRKDRRIVACESRVDDWSGCGVVHFLLCGVLLVDVVEQEGVRRVGSGSSQHLAILIHHCFDIFRNSDALLPIVHIDDVLERDVSTELPWQWGANTDDNLPRIGSK